MKPGLMLVIVAVFLVVILKSMIFSPSGTKYGRPVSNAETVKLIEIFRRPEIFDGKQVKVKGKVIWEDARGYQFRLDDGTAFIHVDLEPSGVAIPQIVNYTVVVEGGVFLTDQEPTLIGQGVEVR